MCASAGAMLTGACLLSLATQVETGLSVVWMQSPLPIACLLCAILFSITGLIGVLIASKQRHIAINGLAVILSACSLMCQIGLALWA